MTRVTQFDWALVYSALRFCYEKLWNLVGSSPDFSKRSPFSFFKNTAKNMFIFRYNEWACIQMCVRMNITAKHPWILTGDSIVNFEVLSDKFQFSFIIFQPISLNFWQVWVQTTAKQLVNNDLCSMRNVLFLCSINFIIPCLVFSYT